MWRLALSFFASMALVASLQAAVAKELSPEQVGSQSHEGPFATRTGSWKTGSQTMMVDGVERTFLLDVPENLQPGAALVVVFHGYGGSAKAIRSHAGFTPLVTLHGFVAVYPQGTLDATGHSFFNVGYDFHKDMKVNDVKFARELVAQLVRDLSLDPDAVFATGMSNGADMCYYLACQPQPFVSAIAPVAGCMLTEWTRRFAPQARMAVMEIHGGRDQITLWNGDLENRDGYGAYLGTEAVMHYWAKCLALEKSDTTELSNPQSKNINNIRLHHWWTTADRAEVRLYEVPEGGHNWYPNLSNREISTATEIWNFFQFHRQKQLHSAN